MTWKPLPDMNDSRRAIEGIEKEFSSRRSFDLALEVHKNPKPPEELVERAIKVTEWAREVGGITEELYELRMKELKEWRA